MITVKFEYNSETEVAVYWLYRDGVPYEMFEAKLSFSVANSLSQYLQITIDRSVEAGVQSVLNKLDQLIDSHYA